MATTPWMTSDDLIAYVKRVIHVPIYQNTLTEEDILSFATTELMSSQVPSVMSFHEEYYVTSLEVPLESGKTRYPIPSRAIGMKLRDIKYKDSNGIFNEMTKIPPEDRDFFQARNQSNWGAYAFYVEGNEIVLLGTLSNIPNDTSLMMYYFQRPNNLVKNNRAVSIKYFTKSITVTNASIVAGDTVTFNTDTVLTAVAGAPSTNEFQIGATSNATASNLALALNMTGLVVAISAAGVVTVKYDDINDTLTSSNSTALTIQSTQSIELNESTLPSNITNSSYVDILERVGGHRILTFDVRLGPTAVSANTITFRANELPSNTKIGDFICSQYESIIPYLPDDLHPLLGERVAASILMAQGDNENLATTKIKIKEMEQSQGSLIDSRVESEPTKVFNKNSLLRQGKYYSRRKW